MGHAIGGVEGVYDRHTYDVEKADALNRLATLLGSILNPPSDKVVQLQPKKGVAQNGPSSPPCVQQIDGVA